MRPNRRETVGLLVGAATAPVIAPITTSDVFAQTATTAPGSEGISRLTDKELHDLTKDAFFWGMHPVGMYELRYLFTQFEGTPLFVGEGHLHWDRKPRTAEDKSVSTPNATTLYGAAYFDLSREPAVVVTPAVPDRYFSVQACDQYPRWYLMIGNQFTGREPQTHLVVGPDYRGSYPDQLASVQVHPAPSNFACFAVRYALKSDEPEEVAAVNALMDQTSIFPLSVWEANGRRAMRAENQPKLEGSYATIPRMSRLVEIATSLTGIDLLQMVSLVLNDRAMTLRKDSAKEIGTLEQLSRLGLRPGVRFDPSWLSDAQKAVVEAAFAEAKQECEAHVQAVMPKMSGNWLLSGAELMPDLQDYVKQGYYGLTTIGAPIDLRSHASAMAFVDSEGRPFDGAYRYTLTFDTNDLPPVTEFWELPIYDRNGYFVDNEINRYSINSFMLDRGKLHAEGGKLVIYIQNEKPRDPNRARNWLPAPKGPFRFVFRFYGPKGGLIDATYDMPGIVRA
ncbi:DUF1214 domain-containing protein [Bradyrhizobium sp. USDA 10063]